VKLLWDWSLGHVVSDDVLWQTEDEERTVKNRRGKEREFKHDTTSFDQYDEFR
jgi:hypothetical protein